MNSCIQSITRIVFEIYLWYFELNTLRALTIYARQYLDANRLVFHTLYFWNDVGEPQFFFCSSDTSNSLSECSKNLKNLSTGKLSRERRDKTIILSLSMNNILHNLKYYVTTRGTRDTERRGLKAILE